MAQDIIREEPARASLIYDPKVRGIFFQVVLMAALALGLPVVLFEAANRLAKTLELIEPLLGDRPVVVARELTKVHETLHRGTARELAEEFRRQPPRGECTVVIGT